MQIAHRTTKWRHKTGRSKKRLPHGQVNYAAVSTYICRRYFPDLWYNIREDVLQEINILVIEAETKKRIKGTRKNYGNGKDRMGIVSFSRAVQARLHSVRKKYGIYRNKTFFSIIDSKETL